MATAGPNQAGTVSENADFETSWTNPSNATADDDSYAVCAMDGDGRSNFLRFTNFGFALGGSDTITAVTVEVACKRSGGTCNLYRIQLVKAGDVTGDENGADLPVGTSEAYLSQTGSLDSGYWNTTLTAAEVNASTFGVQFNFLAGVSASTVSVDACRITLTYTPAYSLVSRTTTCFAG